MNWSSEMDCWEFKYRWWYRLWLKVRRKPLPFSNFNHFKEGNDG